MLGQQARRLLGCSARALFGFPAATQNLINTWNKSNSFLISSRLLSNGILTPKEGGIGIPPELLSSKKVLTPEHVPGQYEDLITRVTNFHDEDKGFMVLDGDVFDVPIRKDIIHRVVRWQLAKRRQIQRMGLGARWDHAPLRPE